MQLYVSTKIVNTFSSRVQSNHRFMNAMYLYHFTKLKVAAENGLKFFSKSSGLYEVHCCCGKNYFSTRFEAFRSSLWKKKIFCKPTKKWKLSLTTSTPCKMSVTCVHSLESWDFSEILFRIGRHLVEVKNLPKISQLHNWKFLKRRNSIVKECTR